MRRPLGITVVSALGFVFFGLAGACDDGGGGSGGNGGSGGGETPVTTITCADAAARDQASRAATHDYYQADVVGYWARHGLPALARLADIRERYGLDPRAAFAETEAYLDGAQLSFMAEMGQLSPALEARFFAAGGAAPGAVMEDVVMTMIRDIVLDGDAATPAAPPNANPNNPSTPLLLELYPIAYPGLGAAFAPAASKECSQTAAPLLDNAGFLQCQLGCSPADAELPGCSGVQTTGVDAGPDDNDTTKNVTTWDNVTGVLWHTTYNPSCVGQGLGQCLAKLGELPQQVTCEAWNDFGQSVGTKAGGSGATPDDQNAYLEGLGYCVSTAYDGLSESACEEAKAALNRRGCDVIFDWPDHQEMVTGIDIDANDDEKCIAHTSSWGSPATVQYASGKASYKSDKSRYPASAKAFQNDVPAGMRIICKCSDD